MRQTKIHLKKNKTNYYCLKLRNIQTQQRKTDLCKSEFSGERERERESILIHKDKDLSTRQLFYKSVPDDKPSNTQYVKQEYKQLRQNKVHLKENKKNYYCLKLRNIQTQQSKTDTNLNFEERDSQTNTQTETEREKNWR